ncbi:helix-turn-helix domain-containing protein [Mycobacterium sp. AMU20-3851]|uniref:PucR family transcriptional regulator n=1 Tax=Mycobacterium sp. AMU20-3851 TaxID=3122055 RepID=UPI003753F1C9
MPSSSETASTTRAATGSNDELQDLVDAWSVRLGRSVAIDDPNFNFLAVSAHFGDEDPIRVWAVLNRGLDERPPERFDPDQITALLRARDHFLRLRITEFTEATWIPGVDEIGLFPRLIVPIRHHGVRLGQLALVDRTQSLGDNEIKLAEEAAVEAGLVLYRRLVMRERRQNQYEAVLRDLFSDDEMARVQAAYETVDDMLVTTPGEAAVLVARLSTTQGLDRESLYGAIDRCLRAEPRGSTLFMVRGRQVAVLLAGLGPDSPRPTQLAMRLLDAIDATTDSLVCTVGIGGQVTRISDSHSSYQQATLAAQACGLLPTASRVATWDELGVYATLMSLPAGDLSDRMIPEAVHRLQAQSDPTDLLHTAEVYLDCACDSRRAADKLYIHRSSLYHRLARIEKIASVSFSDGGDRLNLHLGIKLARVVESYRVASH